MAILRSEKEIQTIQEGGKRHAAILRELGAMVAPGVSSAELDERAYALITEAGDEPAFLDYQPDFAKKPYPASICVSVNEEIVHGLPIDPPKVFVEGDIISIDLGLRHEGLITDAAITVPVEGKKGKISKEARHLLHATRTALEAGLAQARGGNTTGDIEHTWGSDPQVA